MTVSFEHVQSLRLHLCRYLRVAVVASFALFPASASAQDAEDVAPTDQAVAIEPVARDDAIENRIARILGATGWYSEIVIDVDEGIVFIDGIAGSQEQKTWARELAARTEGTVAVVNRLEVREEISWNFAPAFAELEAVARRAVVTLPLIILAVVILPLAWWLSNAIAAGTRMLLAPRVEHDFLRGVIARSIAIPVLLLGVYLILQVAGLTGLAVSLLGGAGVIGIVLGFAFRDIAENFLASLILSIRRPFRQGDVIGVVEFEGVVQTMNTRSTVLLTIDGNHVQIPNATIFKSTIVNYTAGAARRVTADVGIGYEASIGEAQRLIVEVLRDHDAILSDPPPTVLVDELGSSTIKLKAHFWIDGKTVSLNRVKSSALRLIMRVLVDNGISMPDEAREVIFPQGVPMVPWNQDARPEVLANPAPRAIPTRSQDSSEVADAEATSAEGGLGNEITELPDDVTQATIPEAASRSLLSEK